MDSIKDLRVVRGWRRLAVLGTALATISLGLLAAPAEADPSDPPPGSDSATGWYLALGDSLAAGFQPGLGDDRAGGYVGHVLNEVRVLDEVHESAPRTRLTNLGCSGETSTTLMSGGTCPYDQGSQLAQALEFLEAHTYTTRLVTLTIGANDVRPCLSTADVRTCVAGKLATIGRNLSVTLSEIRAAAPNATIVVTNYYNPYLAQWLVHRDPDALGQLMALQAALNGVIESVTQSRGGVTADVATAFASTDMTTVQTSFGDTPQNVAMICATTYMCTRGDIHPNDYGYALFATAVVAKLS